VSKRAREVKKPLQKPALKLNKPSMRIKSSPILKRTLALLKAKKRISSSPLKKIQYSDIAKKMEEFQCHKAFKVIQKTDNSTQTEICTVKLIEKTDETSCLTLKPEWTSRVDNQGVKYYINLLDGTTVYDVKLAKEKTPAKDTIYEAFCNFVSTTRLEPGEEKPDTDQTDFRKEVVDNMKKLIQQNVLVKWRHLEELEKFANIADIIEPSILESGSLVKFDKNIFNDLKVVFCK
jgi:hypothetical protein